MENGVVVGNNKVKVLKGHVKATIMHTKAIVVEWVKHCCYQKGIELKSQQPWTAVSALLDLISMAKHS